MSSIAKVSDHVGVAHRLAVPCDRCTRERVRHGRLVRSDRNSQRIAAARSRSSAIWPGPTRALAFPTEASAFDGGASDESTAAAKIAADDEHRLTR